MKNTYSPEALKKLQEGYWLSLQEARDTLTSVIMLGAKMKSPRAKEYLHNGVGRRLGIVDRCVERVFEICPVTRSKLFTLKEQRDLNINLHAFLLNIYGILDDIAWVVVFEATQSEVTRRQDVKLYGREVQKHLRPETIQFLETMRKWHDDYIKDFRDSLAHRIPAYIPPMQLTDEEAKRSAELDQEIFERIKKHDFEGAEKLEEEQAKLGKLMPFYTHSYAEPERAGLVYLHNQVIIDLNTIVAIIRAVLLEEKGPS